MGGPSLGDIRARLVRLARLAATREKSSRNLEQPGSREALYTLLSYRLPVSGPMREIKQEWMDIIEGKHRLWRGIDAEKRECVRGFLVQFHSEILHRAHRNFNFRGGSIGNFFLAAMQRFFRSIQSAIFFFSALTDIQSAIKNCDVLPAINTNKTTTIAARLADGTQLVGQCEISHPSIDLTLKKRDCINSVAPTRRPSFELQDSVFEFGTHNGYASRHAADVSAPPPASARTESSAHSMNDSDFSDDVEDMEEGIPMSLNDVGESLGNILYGSKEDSVPLSAPIDRLFYVNSYRNEVFPAPNPSYLTGLRRSNLLIYSCGSLWTSIIPCLILRGVPNAIARSPSLKYKVLLLNSEHDRETYGLHALDFVNIIHRSLTQLHTMDFPNEKFLFTPSDFVTHVIYVRGSAVQPSVSELKQLGIQCIGVESCCDARIRLGETQLRNALYQIVHQKGTS
ncbi:LPPG:FO 2-phospho-L-lactate transferase [Malassezia pachydermatis]